ncbi:hypothetical protein JIN85_14700 [Luteolibacter pohnpeiensis]|uniref:Uncharacterized protein n=1 Tax=Luteolibacter pohnpeiensis TaxID=454153 RepID=A0A934SEE7_9BACT|nr:hypothetical protein [Luteolibacter pohnpeiensis]MBK1883668.1 hypothetical protein [Luteolibacter pohnpeiensis]
MEDQLERVTEQFAGEPIHDDGASPRMPFPTSYILNRDQEDEIIEHALNRLGELERESGRDRVGAGDWWLNDSQGIGYQDPQGTDRTEKTWMGKRKLYDLVFDNDVEYRAYLLGGIFEESNLVVPMARRITRQMVARAVNYYFSTDPWFALYPVGQLDKTRADKADRYCRWKMEQSQLKRSLEMATERAFILGESVVKTSWERKEQVYQTTATVLIDAQGNDILTATGDYILESDTWILRTIEDPETGEIIDNEEFVLKRDGKTPQPQQMIWQTKQITRRIKHYSGPSAKVINFLDVLIPLEAPSIQEADCVVHLYDMPVMDLADQWRKGIEGAPDADENVEATKKAIELIRELSADGGASKNAQNSMKYGDGDVVEASQRQNSIVSIAEFHLRYDADGDGMMEDVILIVDRDSGTPIFYDYEANVTPNGLRPFSVVRVNEKAGRWYGIGAMEMFETSQQIVDLTVNRWNFLQSKSARVDFWSPHNTIEGNADPSLKVNWGGTYTPRPGKTAKDCLETVYLENSKGQDLKQFTEFFMQIAMNESGVQHANDSQVAGMDSTKLATGIRNIEKSGQELFSLHLGHLEPGITDVLTKNIQLVMANLDEMEVFHYFEEGEQSEEGENGEGVGKLISIDPGEIADIEVDIKILLTRYRGEQILEGSIRAVELVNKYYSQPYEVQVLTATLYREMLKALQVGNADKVIQPIEIMPTDPKGPNPNTLASGVAPKPQVSNPNL